MNMKIFCCYTKAHEILLRNYFTPSLPRDFELHAIQLEGAGPGDFLSVEFIECIHRKIDLVLESLRTYSGEVLAWSDVDVAFFDSSAAELKMVFNQSGKDILLQREAHVSSDVNAGFFVCHANERVIAFFEKIRDGLRLDRTKNEQHVINQLLPSESRLRWGYLPWAFYARSHGWPPPSDIVLYHANETLGQDGVSQKIAQFQELKWVRRYGTPALAWSCVTKVPKRIKRVLRQRFERLAR